MKLELTHEGASAIRAFADAMPVALENIIQSTEQLIGVYQSVAENVGSHRQDFYDMLMHIKYASEKSRDAIQVLPPMMYKTADKIDQYVITKTSVSGN